MKRPRANPSRIPFRPVVEKPAPDDDSAPRIRTGHQLAKRWQKSLAGIPRWGRILIVAIISLAVTLFIFPQVDSIYLYYFYNENTVIIPAYISAGIGMMMYVIGWFLIVGSTAYKPHEQVSSSPALVWYIGLGVLALVGCTVLLLYGITLTSGATGDVFEITT
jgi:hypothetical protein